MCHMRWSLPARKFYLVCIGIVFLFRGAVAVGGLSNQFSNPPASDSPDENLVYELGDIVDISWATTWSEYNISLRQLSQSGKSNENGGNIFSKISSQEDTMNLTWVVQTYALDLGVSPTFFLSIDSEELQCFTSHVFNITQPYTDSSSNPKTDTTATNDSSTSSPGFTSTGKIALGLGVGVGVPLISLLAILAFFQYRGTQKQYAPAPATMPMALAPASTLPLFASDPPPPPPPRYANQSFRGYAPAELAPKMLGTSPWEVSGACRQPKTPNIPELPDHNYTNYI